MKTTDGKLNLKNQGFRPVLAGLAAVFVLGLWQGLDVRDGAAATGNRWLYGWYGAAFVWGLLLLAGVGYLLLWRGGPGRQKPGGEGGKPGLGKSDGRGIPPPLVLGESAARFPRRLEQIFVVCSLGLGIMYLAILPPLSAPDEVSHYISAYQLSNRLLGKTAADDRGRVLIRAGDAYIEDMEDVLADDGSGPRGEESAVTLGQTVSQDTYAAIHRLGFKGGGPEGTVPSYQPAVHTTPLAYVPQALGITLARVIGLGSLGLLYLGRLFNLLFYCAMGYLTMKRLPFGKELIFGIGLLPMMLHLAASMSYDVMIISMSGYFLAVCLDLAYEAKRVRLRDVAVLGAVMAVMGPCKMVYGVVAGLCLLIPVKKFGGRGKWLMSAAVVLGAFALSMVLVNLQTVALYTGVTDRYVIWAGEPGYSFAQLVHNPFHVLKLFYNTVVWQGGQLLGGMLGSSLGNMDPVLNTPFVVLLGLAVLLVLLALRKPGEPIPMTGGQKRWIWFLCLLCLGALMFSMLLAWTPVSAAMVQGVQGRYLLPLLPMFLFTLKNDRVVRTDCGDRVLLYWMACMNVYVILRIFGTVCLRV